ncbi:MAG: 4Fe-4S dicluster domain-containing protein [Roseiarcus sp.]
MTTPAPAAARSYDLSFARWVRDNVNGGDQLNLCMQCGVCSGSCPIGVQMDYGPRKLFMMIRAGMKDEVLSSNTMWNCTSCYRCVVRCPRGVPVTYILQDLALKSVELGYAKGRNENKYFAKSFWNSTRWFGRTDERLVTALYYFSFGLKEGYARAMANLKIAIGMVKAGRMHLGMPHQIKGKKDLKAILAKAAEIEARQ